MLIISAWTKSVVNERVFASGAISMVNVLIWYYVLNTVVMTSIICLLYCFMPLDARLAPCSQAPCRNSFERLVIKLIAKQTFRQNSQKLNLHPSPSTSMQSKTKNTSRKAGVFYYVPSIDIVAHYRYGITGSIEQLKH
jgi:hypothetical protein